MALTRVYGRVVYPHGSDTPTPVAGDGVIEYVHATPGIIDGAVHGPDRTRIGYVAGVAEDAWLKPGMWRAYVYPDQGRSYTLHLGVPEAGDVTIADAVGEIVPEGIITRGDPGPPGASVTGGRDNGDGTVSFELSDGTFTDPVTVPPGPRGETGPEGPKGDRGETGAKGDKGDTGPKGDRGETGAKGDKGDRGERGEKGDKGDTGPASTIPGPPGTVPTASDYLVVGPGRPDAPTTTGLSSAQIAALPVGCEYRSTNGASVGAWVWRKRDAGWVVTSGDTGWLDRTATVTGRSGGAFKVRRTESTVFAAFDDLEFGSLTSGQPTVTLPTGFHVAGVTYIGAVYAQYGGTVAGGSYARIDFIGGSTIRFSNATSTLRLRDILLLPPSTSPWPTTLS